MDFITWWFNEHYIWSTLLTPVFSFIYSIYEESFGRAMGSVFSFLVWIIVSFMIRCGSND